MKLSTKIGKLNRMKRSLLHMQEMHGDLIGFRETDIPPRVYSIAQTKAFRIKQRKARAAEAKALEHKIDRQKLAVKAYERRLARTVTN
tara:strand:- start:5220 stop:5483 length:264 start_codon:yes stop_codon:yes gene_type:complete